MKNFNAPNDEAQDGAGLASALAMCAVTMLSMFVALASMAEFAQIGPDVGEMVVFDSQKPPRYWTEAGIAALHVADDTRPSRPSRTCILMPPVMSAGGGSLVVEAKELARPPLFRVHWAGARTDAGAGDCGTSADLMLQLSQLRALARGAGGFGVNHVRGLY